MLKHVTSFVALLVCMLYITTTANAKTIRTSTRTGNWGNNSTWNTTGSGNPVIYIVNATHTVTLNSSTSTRVDSVTVYGTLRFNNNRDLTLQNNGVLIIWSGGAVTGGNGNAQISFSGASGSSTIAGGFNTSGPAYATKNTLGFVANAALPVTLVNFEAKPSDNQTNGIVIKWQTSKEENNDHFEIQRSSDGKKWVTIGTLKARGNSNDITDYEFVDPNPPAGMNYYRFVQFDINSKNTVSPVVYATASVAEYAQPLVTMYPNPANDIVNIRISNADTEDEPVVSISNNVGQVMQVPVTSVPGMITLQTSDLPEGIYFLSVQSASISLKQALIIKH